MAISASTARVVNLRSKSDEIRTLDMGQVILRCRDVPEELAVGGDLNRMIQYLLTLGYSAEGASKAARETWDFHHLGSDCLWIAFARDHLWWTFADPQVIWLMNDFVMTGDRVRKPIGGWSNTAVDGAPLTLSGLTSEILSIDEQGMALDAAALRGLLALINGVRAPQGDCSRDKENEAPSSINVPSKLFTVEDVAKTPSAAPDEPGLYAWWFDHLPDVPLDGALAQGEFKLAYVGIASHRPGSRRTLRQRLRNHCAGPIATSTLRRSLAAILRNELNLNPSLGSGDKIRLPKIDEKRLTDWLKGHGRVAWICNATPWVQEDALLRQGPRLALNIRGNTHEFVPELVARRAQFVDIAKAGARSC